MKLERYNGITAIDYIIAIMSHYFLQGSPWVLVPKIWLRFEINPP